MRKIRKMIKKHWITVWIILAITGIASSFVLAEYMGQKNKIMRVAANVAGSGQPFDSNYLTTGNPSVSNVPFNSGSDWCPIEVKIWNYNRNNRRKAYSGALTYALTAQLVKSNGEKIGSGDLGTYTIGISSDGGSSYTNFSGYDEANGYYLDLGLKTFLPNASGNYIPTEHGYMVRFPSVLLDDPGIYVKLTATPTNADTISPISAILGVTKQETSISRVWEGRFNEDTTKATYDSFNYLITGSGEANITLSWCASYLQINAYNLSDYGFDDVTHTQRTENGITTEWSSITFPANSSDTYEDGVKVRDGVSRYDFQVYMTNGLEDLLNAVLSQEGKTEDELIADYWTEMNKYVEFTAVSVNGQ